MKSNHMTMGEEFIQIGLTVEQKEGGGGASGSKEAAAKAYNYNHLLNQIPEPDEPVMKRHSCTLDNESVKDGRCYHDT